MENGAGPEGKPTAQRRIILNRFRNISALDGARYTNSVRNRRFGEIGEIVKELKVPTEVSNIKADGEAA